MIAAGRRAALAAANNARWCDAVGRAHGQAGEFQPSLWLCRGDMPPFYPQAVTLTAGDTAAQHAAVAALAAARPTLAVKDSFAALDLRPLGFNVLFEAQWLWREADAAAPPPALLAWSAVADAAELARWEAAWAGLDEGQAVAPSERIFPPALLAEPGVALLAGRQQGRIVAVAAANRTGDVVGVSNVYAPHADGALVWAGVVAAVARLFPGLPLVGYERGDDLALAQAAGFQPIGPLRVWAR